MNTIQGNSVILNLQKNDWSAYMCATDITVTSTADILPIRTVGDGHFAKNTYQKIGWTVAISGLLIMNDITDTNWTGFDMLSNQLNFSHVRIRLAFTDANGDIKSIAGWCMVSDLSFNASTGALAKSDCTLTSNGELQFFDGLIACDSLITSITPAGLTDPDGNITFTYTYTGDATRVKYRLDGTGPYFYAGIGAGLSFDGVANGDHSIEIIPQCLNGYDADNSTSTAFTVTRGLTCSSTITAITITSTTATPTYTGTAPQYQYRIDGGVWLNRPLYPTPTPVNLSGLATGSHTIDMRPLCANGVTGSGHSSTFTYTAPTTSQIFWQYNTAGTATGYFRLYVNGTLIVNATTASSATITVPNGATIIGQVKCNVHNGNTTHLLTKDTTLGTTLDNQTDIPAFLAYTFTTNGDTFSVQGSIT